VSTGADATLTAVDKIVDRGGDADDVLRAVLETLHELGIAHAAIRFVENGELVDGPSVGTSVPGITVPVVYEGRQIGELDLAGRDEAFAESLVGRIAPYVLVGWDTSGEPWDA
jgi:hypothetical protein